MTRNVELYGKKDNDDYIIGIVYEDNNPSHAAIGFKKPLLKIDTPISRFDDIPTSPYCSHPKGFNFLINKGVCNEYLWCSVMPTYYGFVDLLSKIKNNYNIIGSMEEESDNKIEIKSELDVNSYCDWHIVRNYYELLVYDNFDEIFAQFKN